MADRGVSEIVGAMLTIAVILTAAGIIYAMSHPLISSSIENVNFRNAVKTMSEIKELVGRMKYGNEPATTKTIQLNGGSIYCAPGVKLNIRVPKLPPGLLIALSHAVPNPGLPNAIQHAANDWELDWQLYDLNIDVGGRTISFESGIFVREYGEVNPFPISEPDVVATGDSLYISFYTFTGNFSAGGSKITLNLKYVRTDLIENVTELSLESDFCELWKKSIENALEVQLNDDCSDGVLELTPSDASRTLNIVVVTVEVS